MSEVYSYHTFIYPFVWEGSGYKVQSLSELKKTLEDNPNWECTNLTDEFGSRINDECVYDNQKSFYKEFLYFHPYVRKAIYGYKDNILTNYFFNPKLIQNKAQCLAANECGVYNDVKINVPVDGDGILEYVTSETKNEFDVVLSNGSRLIFISCKDTEITNDHLYEITELARHYGGKYAKVAVVSTVPEATVIKNRAKLSEISIISDVSDMTYDAFKNKIAELGMR